MLLATWHDTYDGTIGPQGVDEISARWHSPEQLKAEMSGDGLFLVAISDGEMAGHSYSYLEPGGAVKLHRLYVSPRFQGRGIGARLLDEVFGHYPGERFCLEVHQDNPGAIRFYAGRGFAVTGRTGHCGGDSDAPAYIMEREVA